MILLLLATFAGISLLLAAVGLFGVLAYLLTQRHTEIGIRLALGAQREHVLHLMLLDGLVPALGGTAAGSLLAIAAAELIRSSLYATKPLDPAVFAGVIGLLVRGCDYGVPATGVARLARTTSDGSTERVMSRAPTSKRDGLTLRYRSPLLRMIRTWLASDGQSGTSAVRGQVDEKRPTLTCDLRSVVRSQSAVWRLYDQVEFAPESFWTKRLASATQRNGRDVETPLTVAQESSFSRTWEFAGNTRRH